MNNIRIRSAVLAFILGNFGVDMLLLRPHQLKLFLGLGGPFLAVAVVGMALASIQTGAWLWVSAAALTFLTFWSLARGFEYLNLTDQGLEQLLQANR